MNFIRIIHHGFLHFFTVNICGNNVQQLLILLQIQLVHLQSIVLDTLFVEGFLLAPTNIAYTPDNTLQQSLSNICITTLCIGDDTCKSLNNCSLGHNSVSNVQTFSTSIRYKPDHLINHLQIIAFQNSVQVIHYTVLHVQYNHQILFSSVCQIRQDPCRFKLYKDKLTNQR